MRQQSQKNDRPDRINSFAVTPLVSAIKRVFRSVKRVVPTAISASGKTSGVVSPGIRFEALEPRVLLSGDVNPAALSVSGSIATPGEQDQYEFTVAESRRVVFDSLTNRSDLNWKLEDANGQITNRSFDTTDYYATSPAFELTPGKYKLIVDGVQDAVGDYVLRLIDADAAADMTPDTQVTGALDGGNKTAVYRFSATAGDKFYLSGSPEALYVDWRLIDPFGRQEGYTDSLNRDYDTFAVQSTGEYLLLIEGAAWNAAPTNYCFNLKTVSDSAQALTLDSTNTALIDQSGKTVNFTFNLADETPVVFDSLTNSPYLWSLTGPKGVEVALQNSTYSIDRMLLAAGDYTLSIKPTLGATGTYAFRLLTAAGAQRLEPGTALTTTLDNACGSAIYKVALNAGDKVFLDGNAPTGGTVNWKLINSYGSLVGSGSLATARNMLTADVTGDYWLVMEGADNNVSDATVAFGVTLNKVPDVSVALTLGTAISGNIDLAGQATVYTFDLTETGQLVFDSHSDRSDLVWSLDGPRGAEVTSCAFYQSDATRGLGALALPAGSYRLTVRGNSGAQGAFGFKLLNLKEASSITAVIALNVPVVGTLIPGNSTQAYQLTLAAGDKIAFQKNSISMGTGTWRLIDSLGRDVASVNGLANNRAAFKVPLTGVYTLLIEGSIGNAAALDFNVQFNAEGNEAPAALPAGDQLVLGTLVSGTLPVLDDTKVFRFALASDQQVIMDTQDVNNSGAVWSLLGPRGTEINQRYLYASDGVYVNPVLNLLAGDYALVVKNLGNWNNGEYSFKLLDALALPTLTLGQQIEVTRSPGNATLAYRVEASAGSKLVLSSSYLNNYYDYFRPTLVDPFGRVVPVTAGDNTGNIYAISVTGIYTLLNESYAYNYSTNVSIPFTLSQQDQTLAPLVLNQANEGVLV